MSSPAGPTHYDVLGVGKDASPDEIKSQYRRLSKIVHSDGGGDDALFRLIRSAYDILSDPDARRAYDRELDRSSGAAPLDREPEETPPGREGFGPASTSAPPFPDWEHEAWIRQAREQEARERAARERAAWESQFRAQENQERGTRVGRIGSGIDRGATTALVWSLLGLLCGVTFPIGFVMGLRARKRISNSNGSLTGSGRALAATIIGGIGTATWVIAFLVGPLVELFRLLPTA